MTDSSLPRFVAALVMLFALMPLQAQETHLRWTGDIDSARSYMVDLAELYKATEGLEIEILYGPTTEVLDRVITRESDMGGSARLNRDDDPAEAQLTMVPIAWDAVVVVVNRDNPVNNLLIREINGLLTGQITHWRELGWEQGGPIRLVRRNDEFAGVETSLQSLVFTDQPAGGYPGERVDDGQAVFDVVADKVDAIGFALFSNARRQPIKILSVEGQSPRQNTIESGSYMLYQPVYLAHLRNPQRRRDIARFLRFASSPQAQRVLSRNGILPYTRGMHLINHRIERERAIRRVLDD